MGLSHALDPPIVQAFDLRTETCATKTTVSVTGEVDLATAGLLEQEIRRAIAAGARTLVVDLSQVGFMSSSGLHVLIRLDSALRARGGRLLIVPAPAVVHDVFRLTRLDERLSFVGPQLPSGAAQVVSDAQALVRSDDRR